MGDDNVSQCVYEKELTTMRYDYHNVSVVATSYTAYIIAYAMKYGRGMDAGTTDKFIGMYVNKWTVEMGEDGRSAISKLLTRGYHAALLPRPVHLGFVE